MSTYGKHIRQNEICLVINNLSWLWVIYDVTINLLVVTYTEMNMKTYVKI